MRKLLPKRKRDAHKGDCGKALIAAGSSGMTGAAVLAGRGALRSGAGLTYLAVPKGLVDFVDPVTPEVITLPFEKIKTIKADAAAVGPGLGVSAQTAKLVSLLIARYSFLVIDADALNVIAKKPSLLGKGRRQETGGRRQEVILTPHPGEMARLLKKPVRYIQNDRVNAAKTAAKKFRSIVVLKGHRTVIAAPSGKTFINPTGNPGMASGGMGDVLTGMIAGFGAQGLAAWDAAVLGVYLHGLAGDLAAKDKGEHALIASDLVEKIPNAQQNIN